MSTRLHCGDHFTICTNIESLCYMLETNIIVICKLCLNNNNTVIPLWIFTALQNGKIITNSLLNSAVFIARHR